MYKMATSLGIPLYVAEEGEKISASLIKEDSAFVIGSNGVFVKRKNPLYEGLFKVEKIPAIIGEVLDEIKTNMDLKIPVEVFRGIESFFMDVYQAYQTEVAVIIYYSFKTKKWAYCVPQQKVSGAAVHYNIGDGATYVHEDNLSAELSALNPADEFVQVGSIHSHAGMNAFHSGVDDKDEFSFDGIHITIGNFNQDMRSYSCRVIFGEKQFKKEVGEVVDCPTFAGARPTSLMDRVVKDVAPAVTRGAGFSSWQGYDDNGRWVGYGGSHGNGYGRSYGGKPIVRDSGKYQFGNGVVIHEDEVQ